MAQELEVVKGHWQGAEARADAAIKELRACRSQLQQLEQQLADVEARGAQEREAAAAEAAAAATSGALRAQGGHANEAVCDGGRRTCKMPVCLEIFRPYCCLSQLNSAWCPQHTCAHNVTTQSVLGLTMMATTSVLGVRCSGCAT
jgi:hypothetical protein